MVVVCKGSRTVLDSGLYAMDSGSWIPYSESCFLNLAVELRIPIVNGISDSLNCIPNSEAQDLTNALKLSKLSCCFQFYFFLHGRWSERN